MNRIFLGIFLSFSLIFSSVSAAGLILDLDEYKKKIQQSNAKSDAIRLPINTEDIRRTVDDQPILLPQAGDNKGVFTNEIVLASEVTDITILFSFETKALDKRGDPYLKMIFPLKKIPHRFVPQPDIDKGFLGGALLDSEESVRFNPPPLIRIPLIKQQYKSPNIAAYFYNPEKKQYEKVTGSLSSNGQVYFVNASRSGIYALYTEEGKIPEKSLKVDPEEERAKKEAEKEAKEKAEEIQEVGGTIKKEKKTEVVTKEKKKEEKEIVKKEEEKIIERQKENISEKEPEEKNALSQEKRIVPENWKTSFHDIGNHWSKSFVETLEQQHLARGTSAVLYEPDAPATRADAIFLVASRNAKPLEISSCLDTYMPSRNTPVFFRDTEQNDWYAPYVCIAAIKKLTKGLSDGTFGGENILTRAEALKFLSEASGKSLNNVKFSPIFADVSSQDWFSSAVLLAAEEGVTSGFDEETGELVRINAKKLFKGDKSDHVKSLQKILQKSGFYQGAIDGALDEDVRLAVFQYQLNKGIVQTFEDEQAGNVGPSTIETLNAENIRFGGNGTQKVFRPHAPVTRGELAKFAAKIFGL